jgi:pimeloyl-ACP methyl ester carboxylesterase
MNFLVQQQPAFVFVGAHGFTPGKPTTVLVHGAANDHRVFAGLAERLATPTQNVIAVDLPGHGGSFGEPKRTIEETADWIIHLLDNGGVAAANVIGHSMGSLIALDCARRHASRVEKLVLIGTAAPMPVADKVLDMAANDFAAACDMLTRASFYVPRNPDGGFPPPTPIMLNYRAWLGEARPGVLATDMQACHQYAIDEAALSAVTTPTRVVIGEFDRMTTPEAGQAVAAAIPGASHVVIPHAGHAMMLEAPDAVAGAIGRFIGNS